MHTPPGCNLISYLRTPHFACFTRMYRGESVSPTTKLLADNEIQRYSDMQHSFLTSKPAHAAPGGAGNNTLATLATQALKAPLSGDDPAAHSVTPVLDAPGEALRAPTAKQAWRATCPQSDPAPMEITEGKNLINHIQVCPHDAPPTPI